MSDPDHDLAENELARDLFAAAKEEAPSAASRARALTALGLEAAPPPAGDTGTPTGANGPAAAPASTVPWGAVAAVVGWKKQGLDAEIRIQKAKTMNEKYGVVGNDVFFGSANFSESSSTKHSENRIAIKNDDALAARFQREFETLWSKSKDPK